MYTRQVVQTTIQFLTLFVGSLIAVGGYPEMEQLYMSFLTALAGALALFGGSKINVGGVENEEKIVKALYTDPTTNQLLVPENSLPEKAPTTVGGTGSGAESKPS